MKGHEVYSAQVYYPKHPTKAVLEIVPFHIVFPKTDKGNVSKYKPSKTVVENMPKNVAEVPKLRTKSPDVDSKNLTQNLE